MLNQSNRRRSKKPNCNTPEMERLHPDCVLNTDPEKEIKRESRRRKIHDFFQEYRSQVGSPNLDINPTYQNRYVDFVRSLKDPRKTDQKWIYDHFVCDKWNPECVPEYVEDENKQRKTQIQRQRLRFRASERGIKEQIENAYSDPSKNKPFITNIQKIFSREEGIGLEDKIEFIFDFKMIKRKLRYIQRRLYNNPIDVFINESLQNDFLRGDMMMNELFIKHLGPDLHKFLVDMKILNKGILDEYNLQYTHQHRQAAFYTLSEIYKNYCDRIHLIYFICLRNLTKFTNKQMIMKMMNQKMILEPLEKYLFYTNYGLINFFEKKEEILATSFEDFYYLHLKQNILFILSFLQCNDFSMDGLVSMGAGAYGGIYKINETTVFKITIEDEGKIAYERTFFEFFKQCCVYHLFSDLTIPSYILKIGPNRVGYTMKNVNGITYLKHYMKWIFENKSNPNFDQLKYNKILYFLQNICKIIQQTQKSNFIHRDLNFRNIMIDENDHIRLIDFDFSIISFHNINILNYRKQLTIDHIFEKNESNIFLSPFAKSIDLFRIMIHYFIMHSYLSKYELLSINNRNKPYFIQNPQVFDTNPILLNQFREKFYGTSNPNIPTRFESYFTNQAPFIVQKYSQYKAFAFANIFEVREYIYQQSLSTLVWRSRAKLERNDFYTNWIQPFLPHNFLYILSQISMNHPTSGPMEFYRPPQYNKTKSPILNLPSKGGKKKTTKKKTTKRKS